MRPAGASLGGLTPELAASCGLPPGIPICTPLGDNQASCYGAVADLANTVLVNVGTGGQVAVHVDEHRYSPNLETRPFPHGGYLLVKAGLCGGRTYAILERFFRQVAADCSGATSQAPVYEAMNRLSATVAKGADGLRCNPLFTGTRDDPELRAAWTGMSERNFTPAHMVRALLEGMARLFHQGYGEICQATGAAYGRLVGAGNGLRENTALATAIADEFGIPLAIGIHREEAAFGAALVAAVGLGVVSDPAAARRLIRYQ